MAQKAKPERVNPTLARQVIKEAKDSHDLYSKLVIATYRTTGHLAPSCDARDLIAWYEKNMPDELAAITKKNKTHA